MANATKSKKESLPSKLLTEVELEMMTVLWEKGPVTVTEVQAALGPQRKLAYTSVSTMLRILEQKGAVESRKEGRGHVYLPRLQKQDYEARSLRHLVDRVFGGAPAHLVERLLDSTVLSDQELGDIRKMLDEKWG